MKKIYLLILPVLMAFCSCSNRPEQLVSCVNPMIGTDYTGHTYPGATLPFGMVQLSPDTKLTGWQGCSGYHYEDSVIYGFSHTHLSGTGVEDYCDILVMPTTGKIQWENKDYRSDFRHASEKASAGYYAVTLDKYKIQAELTATARVGFHRYTFPEKAQANILFDLKHRGILLQSGLKTVGDNELCGYRRVRQWAQDRRIYFVAKFSEPFTYAQLNDSTKAVLNFAGKNILVKVGLSSVSVENARKNLEAELPGWDFDRVKADAESAWEQELSKIIVEGGSQEEYTTFYTALYHTAVVPNLYMDVNGEYAGRYGKTGKADFDNYTVFSLWDTYRAAHPLYTIINPKRNRDFVKSFIRLYEEGGLLPVWELAGNETFCMIGHHAVSVIADAYMKGDRDFDVEKTYEACKQSADTSLYGLQYFIQQGYIPLDKESESVSKTLEYAYDAWCIAQMAKVMGKEADYAEYIQRAQYYKNIYDASTGFMRAKSNETWHAPFDPFEVNSNYTEANSWQYSFYVPQDIDGLARLHGGKAALAAKIDELFAASTATTGRNQSDITGLIGQYAHGNEPSHHVPYLYTYLGQPWKTQKMVRYIMDELYGAGNDGLCGNEDCGQMSAWYVMSALGFYQVAPGADCYAIGTPLFEKATINLENGKRFVIKADKPSTKNCYIQSATLNGVDYKKAYITHADIMNGGELSFVMGSKPNPEWGIGAGNEPVSTITDHLIVPVPTVLQGHRTFRHQDTLVINIPENSTVYYTVNGAAPSEKSMKYEDPVVLQKNTVLRAVAVDNGKTSKEVSAMFNKIPVDWKLSLEHRYARNYPASGDDALIDHIKGLPNFRSATWQGFYGVDMVATLDLGKVRPVRELSIGFLQESDSWIFFPPQVRFYVSNDGKRFTERGVVKCPIDPNLRGSVIYRFKQYIGQSARYVKIVADNFGTCPDWHVGAGTKTFLFADEIEVK